MNYYYEFFIKKQAESTITVKKDCLSQGEVKVFINLKSDSKKSCTAKES